MLRFLGSRLDQMDGLVSAELAKLDIFPRKNSPHLEKKQPFNYYVPSLKYVINIDFKDFFTQKSYF
jgi:hypothetical protein